MLVDHFENSKKSVLRIEILPWGTKGLTDTYLAVLSTKFLHIVVLLIWPKFNVIGILPIFLNILIVIVPKSIPQERIFRYDMIIR